ncbi:MAG TPA: hypothetical protein VH597_14235 [Verrucomicrobiae bacterium]|jgi:hypothetical protein|nr:hypothetical protein [Verrucomicrobiae bacterium]
MKFFSQSNDARRWFVVVLYATAMAWVESAVVFYLRSMIDRIEPYQPNPLPIIGGFGPVELVRELATMIMLFAVGALAGRNWRARLGYSAIAFGVWDIFYYVFLKMMCGWPHSVGDWDILFLLPLPWWGPVWAPVAIALLMIAWGTLASQFEEANSIRPLRRLWLMNFLGIAIALYVFMADCLHARHGGVDAIRNVLPSHFSSALFCVALGLMAAPVLHLGWRIWSSGFEGNVTVAIEERFSCKRSPQN